MSEEETLREIKHIFNFLTEQEPTPDDEIEAKEKLIGKFKILKDLNSILEKELIETILNDLENWETLDLWFSETKLPENIGKLLQSTEKKEKVTEAAPFTETKELPTDASLKTESSQIDLSQIVAKVSEQFEGEISGLKKQIEQLQSELENKEKELKGIALKRKVQKITPSKVVKLAPPKIKIPSIKKPEKPLKIKVETDSKFKETKELIKLKEEKTEPISIEEKIELISIKKKIEPISFGEKEVDSEYTLETPDESELIQDSPRELLSIPQTAPKLSPTVSEGPNKDGLSEIPFKSSQEPSLEDELARLEAELMTPSTEELKTSKTEEKRDLGSLPKDLSLETKEKEDWTPMPTKAPTITEDLKLTSIFQEKPDISPISVEEIDTDEIRPSGADLFNVFSSMDKKTAEQPIESVELEETISTKSKKKKAEKKKAEKDKNDKKKKHSFSPIEIETPLFSGFGAPEPKSDIDTLPMSDPEERISSTEDIEEIPSTMDKDTLYQELIALEGKRYSLEKNFKDTEKKYKIGKLSDGGYQDQSLGLKQKLDEISSRITEIRRIISSL